MAPKLKPDSLLWPNGFTREKFNETVDAIVKEIEPNASSREKAQRVARIVLAAADRRHAALVDHAFYALMEEASGERWHGQVRSENGVKRRVLFFDGLLWTHSHNAIVPLVPSSVSLAVCGSPPAELAGYLKRTLIQKILSAPPPPRPLPQVGAPRGGSKEAFF
jgi:hypothetical protein